MREQLDSVQWQLKQERSLRSDTKAELKNATDELCNVMQERNRLQDTSAQQAVALAAAEQCIADLNTALAESAGSLKAELAKLAGLRNQAAQLEQRNGDLTDKQSEAVDTLQAIRAVNRTQEERLHRLKAERAAAWDRASETDARVHAAVQALDDAVASGAERDDLLRDFTDQVLHLVEVLKCNLCLTLSVAAPFAYTPCRGQIHIVGNQGPCTASCKIN
jgi:chromosome segregation ATPase